MNNRVRIVHKTPLLLGLTCLIVLLAGCNQSGMTSPTVVYSSTATITKTPEIQPSLTSTYTPEPTLPYGITKESLGKLKKKPSEIAVDWRSSLKELGSGEYIITFEWCREEGDCGQILAYSVEEMKTTPLARFPISLRWSIFLADDRLYMGVGEQFSVIQVIDFRNGEDFSMQLPNQYGLLDGIHHQKYLYIASGVVQLSPELYISIPDYSVTALNGLNDSFSVQKKNYIVTTVEDNTGCHPVLMNYDDFQPIPLGTDCDDKIFTWADTPSGKWIWGGATDEETYWETVFEIPGTCLLEHPDDVEYCRQSAEEKFSYQGEFYCIKRMIWTQDERSLILEQTNDPYYCSIKGVELIGADGSRKVLRSHPGFLQDDLWTSDGNWIIWDGGADEGWGFYSPYDGGKVKYLGKGIVFDFSIIQVP